MLTLQLKKKGDYLQMRILVVEDEVNLNDIIVKKLKLEHYGVDSCFDGKEALDYIFSIEYDVIILDIMLPKLDGFEVLKKIRKQNIKTPVLLLTAILKYAACITMFMRLPIPAFSAILNAISSQLLYQFIGKCKGS